MQKILANQIALDDYLTITTGLSKTSMNKQSMNRFHYSSLMALFNANVQQSNVVLNKERNDNIHSYE